MAKIFFFQGNRSKFNRQETGLVLILALWTLSLLTVFAVNIGISIKQKISLLERLERRQNLQLIAESGVRKAIAIYRDLAENPTQATVEMRQQKMSNNPEDFKDVSIGPGNVSVCQNCWAEAEPNAQASYGVLGEEAKININQVDRKILKRLFELKANLEEEDAQKFADAVIDWREYGETEIEGFYSDEYYDNLEHPYPPKKAPFEILEEVLLVEGMSPQLYRKIRDSITIYGSGQVNVNETNSQILEILGLPKEIADKIIDFRSGADNLAATLDDPFFHGPGDLISGLQQSGLLSEEEIQFLRDFVATGILSFRSTFYIIHSQARLAYSSESKDIVAVFESESGKIVYWKE